MKGEEFDREILGEMIRERWTWMDDSEIDFNVLSIGGDEFIAVQRRTEAALDGYDLSHVMSMSDYREKVREKKLKELGI